MRNYNISPDASGDGAESDFINRVLKRIMAELQFYDSGTITWEQTTRGVRAHVINPTFGGQSETQLFVLVSDSGDWYNCYTLDGAAIGTEIIKVAKHQDIRCIISSASPSGGAWSSKLIRGVTYSYTYNKVLGTTDDGVGVVEYTRSVNGSDTSSATSYITPYLAIGDIITAIPFNFTAPETLNGVQWLALADGRAWADPSS